MPEGVMLPPIPLAGSDYSKEHQDSVSSAVEQALQEISDKLTDIKEVSEENIAEVFEGIDEQTTPEDTDKVVLSLGSGSLKYVNFSAFGGGGGGAAAAIAPPSGRYYFANKLKASAASSVSLTFNRIYFVPFMVSRSMTAADVGWVGVSGSVSFNRGVAIYNSDPDTGWPSDIIDSSVVAGTISANQFFSVSVDLESGVVYWMGVGVAWTTSIASAPDGDGFGAFGDATVAYNAADDLFFYIVASSFSSFPDPFSGTPTLATETSLPLVMVGTP